MSFDPPILLVDLHHKEIKEREKSYMSKNIYSSSSCSSKELETKGISINGQLAKQLLYMNAMECYHGVRNDNHRNLEYLTELMQREVSRTRRKIYRITSIYTNE